MELRVAAEPSVECGIEQCDLPARIAFALVVLEESLHALAVAELDNRQPRLLFEEAAETRRTETGTTCELREVVAIFVADQQACRALDCGMHAACRHLAGAIETLPRVQQRVGEAGVQQPGFAGGVGKLREELLES